MDHDTLDPRGPTQRSAAINRAVARLAVDPHVVGRLTVPASTGVPGHWPHWLDPRIRSAYERRGISTPWRHQSEAAELAWAGRHVIVATGTASGKTAAFGMPGLTAALSPAGSGAGLSAPGGSGGGRGPSVLYLAPTKALAHDQLAGLRALELPGLRAGSFDSDSTDEERTWARSHARWLLTNPDMLHHRILPGHERWRGLLRSLRFVVVDEAHVYRGVFGAHVALVLRRLRRVARHHGSDPTFVFASATVADAARTATRLLGAPVDVVDDDCHARGVLELLLWDPEAGGAAENPAGPDLTATSGYVLTHAAGPEPTSARPRGGADPGGAADSPPDPDAGDSDTSGVRTPPPPAGTLAEVAELMAGLVDQKITTLVFARSRRAVEVVATRAQQRCVDGSRVRAYRGGYLPEERRALEADLRSGRLLGVAATNALELGIDVSGVDAVLLAGWPGTTSSFWQQVGRAGRHGSPAMAVLIPREDPLDRYVVSHPESLTGAVEATALDPSNPYVVAGHLCSAAAELALLDSEIVDWFGPSAPQLCATLADQGLLRRRRTGWYWTDRSRPTDLVDLRGAGGGPVRVIEDRTGRLLGTVDPANAPATVHTGAIYVHQGATYEVLDLDLAAQVAVAAPTVTDLSTHARSRTHVQLDETRDRRQWGEVGVWLGAVTVTTQVTSYQVRRWPSGHVIGEYPVDLPESALTTTGMWWTIPESVLDAAGGEPGLVAGAVHALEHAAIGLLPLVATCDRWDVGGMSTPLHPQTGQTTIVVHDGQPGGAGFAERGYDAAEVWLRATAEVIAACPCPSGCPRCVQSPKCGNGNEPLDKAAALRLAEVLLRSATP